MSRKFIQPQIVLRVPVVLRFIYIEIKLSYIIQPFDK
jgi:hypothetical protein